MEAETITFANKRPGDLFTHQEANSIKVAVNQHAEMLDAHEENISLLIERQNNAVSQLGNANIKPNVLNQWGDVESLTVTFVAGSESETNEYMMQFTVASDDFVLELPSTVRWMEEPEWTNGNTYQVSILNNLAIFAEWEAEES